MLQFYGYNKCNTCRNAKKWLEKAGVLFQEIDITSDPPSASQLKKILTQSGRELINLLNRSGLRYRALNMKEKVKTLPEAEILEMMAQDGRLIKRPIVTNGQQVTVGFQEDEFKRAWGSV